MYLHKSYKLKSTAVEILITCMPSSSMQNYLNPDYFSSLCQQQCKNYNAKWSCPPHSPTYTKYAIAYKNIIILTVYMKLDYFYNVRNKYTRIKAANSILKSRAEKIIRYLSSKHNSKYISTGSCRLCKPCRCKLNEPCKHPELMGYSFEALGINVEQLCLDLFDHKLLWYKDKIVPEYTSVVVGVLHNGEITEEEILTTISKVMI
jgi:predicted metal-binding protein